MWLIDQLAEARIEEAMAHGQLDDLPGAGKLLSLDDDSQVPEELRAAYRLLKNAGYVPPEVQLRREIADAEQLLTLVEAVEEYIPVQRRLRYLLTRLSLSRGAETDLRVEQAYYQKLAERVG